MGGGLYNKAPSDSSRLLSREWTDERTTTESAPDLPGTTGRAPTDSAPADRRPAPGPQGVPHPGPRGPTLHRGGGPAVGTDPRDRPRLARSLAGSEGGPATCRAGAGPPTVPQAGGDDPRRRPPARETGHLHPRADRPDHRRGL